MPEILYLLRFVELGGAITRACGSGGCQVASRFVHSSSATCAENPRRGPASPCFQKNHRLEIVNVEINGSSGYV